MTLKQACDDLYLPKLPKVATTTRRKLESHWRRWKEISGCDQVSRITTETFIKFRQQCLLRNLSPVTCETIISDVLTILSVCRREGLIEFVPDCGRRLSVPVQDKETATLEALSKVYEVADQARWPPQEAATAWRVWLVTAYTTGLRLSDLQRLRWDQVRQEWIQVKAAKTNKLQRLPVHRVFARHLNLLPKDGERVFWMMSLGVTRKIRRTLRELCELANVDYFTPQMIRRLTGREYERAHGGAGRLLLGHGLGRCTAFYLSEFEILQSASDRMKLPSAFYSEAERNERYTQVDELSRVYRDMSPEQRQALLTVARSMK